MFEFLKKLFGIKTEKQAPRSGEKAKKAAPAPGKKNKQQSAPRGKGSSNGERPVKQERKKRTPEEAAPAAAAVVHPAELHDGKYHQALHKKHHRQFYTCILY